MLNFKSKCPNLQYVSLFSFNRLLSSSIDIICKTFNLNLLVKTKLGCGDIQSQLLRYLLNFINEQKGA